MGGRVGQSAEKQREAREGFNSTRRKTIRLLQFESNSDKMIWRCASRWWAISGFWFLCWWVTGA